MGRFETEVVLATEENLAALGDLSSQWIDHMHELISSKNKEFVHDVAVENVKLQMKELYNRSLVLREMIDSGELKLVGAMYAVATGKVSFFK